MVKCLHCTDNKKRVYPFNPNTQYNVGCFNNIQLDRDTIKKCFKNFGNSKYNCIIVLIMEINVNEFTNVLSKITAKKVYIYII